MCLKVSSQSQLCCLEVNIRFTQGRAAHTLRHCLFLAKAVEESTSLTPHQQKILSPSIDLNLSNCFSLSRDKRRFTSSSTLFVLISTCIRKCIQLSVLGCIKVICIFLCVSQHPFLCLSYSAGVPTLLTPITFTFIFVCAWEGTSRTPMLREISSLSQCVSKCLSPPSLPLLTTVYQLSRTRRGSFFHISLLDHREGALSRRPPSTVKPRYQQPL